MGLKIYSNSSVSKDKSFIFCTVQFNSAENMSLSQQLAMNITVVVDPDRDFASVRRASAFGKGYLQGILAIFLPKTYQKIQLKRSVQSIGVLDLDYLVRFHTRDQAYRFFPFSRLWECTEFCVNNFFNDRMILSDHSRARKGNRSNSRVASS